MSNLNLEPFELSKWKDVLKEIEEEDDDSYINIYKGIGTDENDLEFWYSPRRWEGGHFTSLNNKKVTVDINLPSERNSSLVHLDFSTSNLMFEPNTYYTFLLQLDFKNGKIPNWEAYSELNPLKESHYLISLVRQDVPGSMWNMPKPIFDSSLALSYGHDGFNLRNSEFNKDHETGQVFTYTQAGENKVLLIGCLKTNDFLKEHSTLGMWSFLEAWVNDYWKADMEVNVFKDEIIEIEGTLKPKVYSKLYKDISGNEYQPFNNNFTLRQKAKEAYEEAFPIEEPISENSSFYLIKQKIDEIITRYYVDLRDYINNFINNSERDSQTEKNLIYADLSKNENFQQDYGINEETNKFPESSNYLNAKIYDAGLEVAKIFYSYFPDLTFPYREQTSKNNFLFYENAQFSPSFDFIILRYLETVQQNSDLCEVFSLSDTILLPPIYKENTLSSGKFYLGTDENIDILDTINEEHFIESKINEYWINFNTNNENKIYKYLNDVYGLNNKDNDKLSIFYNDNNNNMNKIASFEIFHRRGISLSWIPSFKELSLLINQKFSYSSTISKIKRNTEYMIAMFFPAFFFTFYEGNNNINEPPFELALLPYFYSSPKILNDSLDIDTIETEMKCQTAFFKTLYQDIATSFVGTILNNNEPDNTRKKFNKTLSDIFILKSVSIDSLLEINIKNKKGNIQYLEEEKQFVFGSLEGGQSFAQNVVLTEDTKDAVNTLTFSLYNYYYNDDGVKEESPFIKLLHEEDKLKLKYKNKWYDFFLVDSNLDSSANRVDYIAKDANVIELSKIGFNKTFNTELDNNVGTINELALTALKDTNWELAQDKTEKFYQGALKPVIGGKLKSNITIKASKYYYNKNLEQTFIDQTYIINSGSFVYIFYNEDSTNNNITYKIICPELKTSTNNILKTDYKTMNNTLIDVCLYPNVEFYNNGESYIPSNIEYIVNNITITSLDIFENDIDFNYALRATDIVIKPIMHYSVPLKRYVTEYKDTSNNNKIYYGYVESEYSTKPLIQNLLPNGEDFISLDGWINGAVNDAHSIGMSLGAAKRGSSINTITPYLNFKTSVESGSNRLPHGFVCNTGLSYNFANIHNLEPNDEFVLRVQVERGDNFSPLIKDESGKYKIDDQLTLMETCKPYLYFYNNISTLQSKNSLDVLPSKEKKVLDFIQERRFKNLEARIEDGGYYYRNSVLSDNYNSNNATTILDLKNRIDKEGLVSIHWTNHDGSASGLSNTDIINDFPIAYIPKKVADDWEKYGYIKTFEAFKIMEEKVGNNKKYGLLAKGREMIQRLVDSTFYPHDGRASDEGVFHLRDFFIVADKIVDIKNGFNNDLENPIPPGTTEIKYYLPMLFSDAGLWNEMGLGDYIPNPSEEYFHKNFFKFKAGGERLCWKALETKEYYILKKPEGAGDREFNAFPQNINIDFGDEEENIACNVGNDYNDFDRLMRMRIYWYLQKYSRTGSCIFETRGTFYGKPLKEDNDYVYKKGAIGPIGYTYQDLLTNHLGLFFTFDQTVYDDGAHGSASLALSKIEFFRKYEDKDGNLLLPNKIIDSNTTPIYKLYDPTLNKDVIKEDEIKYFYTDIKLEPKYEINLDLTGEKRNSITVTESNCYNILQKLAEIFNGWLVIDVKHDDTGKLLLNQDTHMPIKQVYFINNYYTENFSGIKYGINLKKINRKIDSNEVITKLIVKNNNNEFGTNGFCSIARSKYNLSGSNAIFNLDYLISTNQLPEKIKVDLYNKIYPRTYAYGQFLSSLIAERAQQLIILSQTQAEADYNKMIINETKEKLADSLDKYEALGDEDKTINGEVVGVGYFINNKEATQEKDVAGFQNIINTIIFYQSLVDGFTSRYKDSITQYNNASDKYSLLQDITEGITCQRDSLITKFQDLCQGRIKEGAWSSEDYIDDDLYYLDGERQLQEYAQPRVTYNIDIVDISSLPEWKNYDFNLRDKTTIEDPQVFGYIDGTPVKEDIIITAKTSHLQSPEQNTITVQNYKTQFNDLFQRIASTIQAVEFGTLNYTNKNSDNNIEKRLSNNESELLALKLYNGL